MLNKIHLIGRLGADPETRRLESGKTVAKFTLATSETWKNANGEKQEETQWHNIVVWEGLAEIAEKYLKKGSLIYVEGKMTYRTYEGEDGQKKYFSEVRASTFKMLGGKPDNGGGNSNGYFPPDENPNHVQKEPVNSISDDNGTPAGELGDLPF